MINCNKNKCTCFIDGIFGKYWGDCCAMHDYYYIYNSEGMTRIEVDTKLYKCVSKQSKMIGIIVYCGVRIFGIYYWNYYKNIRV